jgi:hypothetical protein
LHALLLLFLFSLELCLHFLFLLFVFAAFNLKFPFKLLHLGLSLFDHFCLLVFLMQEEEFPIFLMGDDDVVADNIQLV